MTSRTLLNAALSTPGWTTDACQSHTSENSSVFKTLFSVLSVVEDNITIFRQRSPNFTGYRSSNASLSNFQRKVEKRAIVFTSIVSQSAVWVHPLKISSVLTDAKLRAFKYTAASTWNNLPVCSKLQHSTNVLFEPYTFLTSI